MCLEMRIASFKLLHINCMAMSRNITKLEKKLYRKLLKTQINIENLLQELSINTFQTYQQIENGLIMLLASNLKRLLHKHWHIKWFRKIPSYILLPSDENLLQVPSTFLSDAWIMCIMYPKKIMSHFHQQYWRVYCCFLEIICKHVSSRWPINMARAFYGTCRRFQPLYPKKVSHYVKKIRSISSWH